MARDRRPPRRAAPAESPVTKREVVDTLEEIAILLELTGENAFKTRAYANAARTLQGLDRDLAELVAGGELRSLKGIGPALAEKIGMLVTTGRLPYLEELRAQVPPGLLELLRVPGLGPKRVREVYAKLGIASLAELEYAAGSRALQELEGFGEKLQGKILDGIAALKRHADRFLLSDALAMGEEILAAVAALPGARRAAIAGSLRRRCETVGNVDLVAATDDAPALLAAFAGLPEVAEVLPAGSGGAAEASVRLAGGLRVRLRAVPERDFAGVLRYLTGSREHDEALRAHAAERGFELDERGLRRAGAPVAAADEDAIFAALGLAAIAPELREGRGGDRRRGRRDAAPPARARRPPGRPPRPLDLLRRGRHRARDGARGPRARLPLPRDLRPQPERPLRRRHARRRRPAPARGDRPAQPGVWATSGSSRESSATSSPTARSTTRTGCWRRSSWWSAPCTAASGSARRR